MPAAESAQKNEVTRLKARVKELEAELADKGGAKSSARSEKRKEADKRVRNESSDIAHGIARAYLEGLRISADILESFADKTIQTLRPSDEDDEEGTKKVGDVYSDVVDAYVDAYRDLADLPAKAIDKFYDTYKESS